MTDLVEAIARFLMKIQMHPADDGYDICLGCEYEAQDIIRAIEDAGYAVVPVEPTEKMRLDAAEPFIWFDPDSTPVAEIINDMYRAMLAARPEVTQ